ncbi:MAG TPA: hypothetical protein VG838_14725 [Opitutaceae bacterium]|nr:hypothetical protein [Opitutaceae bacterium]
MHLPSLINQMLPQQLRPADFTAARYVRWSKYVVQAGPFRGLRYIDRAFCSSLAPKIAGVYEKELQSRLAQWAATQPDVLIDIGAAEGYYAVGAAYAGWSKKVIAYEIDPQAREAMAELMARNQLGPEQIELREACTPSDLDALLASYRRPVVIMDAEGYESLLLDPLRVPNLRHCPVLVEYHDFLVAGLSAELARRMSPTHTVEVITPAPRTGDDLRCGDAFISALPAGIRRRAIDERRPFHGNGWLWLTPRIPRSSST